MSDLEAVKLTIKNCNNIDNGSILIQKNILNIKYGINGTGKSSIAKAISCFSKDQNNDSDSLKQLKPFKCIGQAGNDPEISGMDEINNVRIFNEEYVDTHIFVDDELIKGSFDIFIRNDAYEKGLKEINELVAIIGKTFDENEEIDNLIADLKELSSSFGKTTKSGIHASSIFSKAFKNGNKVTNIPKGLENYKDYIRHDENYKWIKWQLDGQPYLNITENCPYCVSNIEEKKETIEHITEVYDSKSVQNLNTIINLTMSNYYQF